EAAVAAPRTRNFILSSGILALLATAIGLIVVSARRADRLARQQLEFVAAVSHELRTPVAVIGAAAGNLSDGAAARRHSHATTTGIRRRGLARAADTGRRDRGRRRQPRGWRRRRTRPRQE